MTTPAHPVGGRPTLDAGRGAGRRGPRHGVPGRQRLAAGQPARRGPPSQQAIDELGYVPNRAARALVTQRTDSVALVVSESEERVFGEPFFAGIVRGISSALLETPLQLWLAMAQSQAERERVEHHLTTQHVDGVLLLSLHDADPLPTLLAAARPAGRRSAAGRRGCCRPAATRWPATSTPTTPAARGRRWRTCSARAARGSPRSPARRTWAWA